MKTNHVARTPSSASGAKRRSIIRNAVLAFVLLIAALPALGQCALCYESASAAGKKGQSAISRAILVLLTPTLGMMAGLVTLAVRYKGVEERKHDDEHEPLLK
jgi:hypothetical protein